MTVLSRSAVGVFSLSLAFFIACAQKAAPINPGPVDSGLNDAGSDGGNTPSEVECDLAAPTCDAGESCMVRRNDAGVGTRCFPGACDVVRQNCDAGDKCTYVTTTTTERKCTTEGAVDEGQPCVSTATSNTCKKGMLCVTQNLQDGGTADLCSRFCNTHADCVSPQECYISVEVTGTQELPRVCGAPPPNCDLLGQNCAQPADGCYPNSTLGPICVQAGATANGAACTYSNDCVKGSACISQTCRQLCQRPTGAPACSAGTCRELFVMGVPDAGFCLP